MYSLFDISCSASAKTSRIPFIFLRAYSPCGSVYYHFLFGLGLILAIAYLYLVWLCLQPPTQDDLASEPPRASPGRSAAVAKGLDVPPSLTLSPEEAAKSASASDQDTPPRQHGSPERSSSLSKGVPKGRSTSAQAPGPDARPPSRSPSTPVPSVTPQPPSPDVTQVNAKRTVQRGASLPTSGKERSHDYVPTPAPPPSTRPSPLNQVLYIGSKDTTQITSLDILVVPYGQDVDKPIKDPEIDAKYLCDQFGELPDVAVHRILNREVTLDQVDEAITARWKAVRPKICLLVLLTGHGDGNNAMMLRGGDRIDESHLNKLFLTLRQVYPKQLRVAIVFDICRGNQNKEAAVMHNVALVWSCSPGQEASAFRFKTLREPSSVFLLAVLMAAHDACQSSGNFEEHFKARVAQLAKLNNHANHVRGCKGCHVEHVVGCKGCNPPHFCPEAFVMREESKQDVDLEQSQGFLNDLFSFLETRKGFCELSKTVFDFMSTNNAFLRSNGLPLAHPIRGANQLVSQASGK